MMMSMRFTLPLSCFSSRLRTCARISDTSSVASVDAALTPVAFDATEADPAPVEAGVLGFLGLGVGTGRERVPITWAFLARKVAAVDWSLAVRSSAIFFSNWRSFSSSFRSRVSCSRWAFLRPCWDLRNSFWAFSRSSAVSSRRLFSFCHRLAISVLFFLRTSSVLLSLCVFLRDVERFWSLSWIRVLSLLSDMSWPSVFCFCMVKVFISAVSAFTVSSKFLDVMFLWAAPIWMRRTRVANCRA
mmetsp:Transcript_4609/g.13278  ORF Transcript_4609/g.13278 Transcript_4609/m.13278 type:complete len:244 (-) Transcript_4609:3518-4249(-)